MYDRDIPASLEVEAGRLDRVAEQLARDPLCCFEVWNLNEIAARLRDYRDELRQKEARPLTNGGSR